MLQPSLPPVRFEHLRRALEEEVAEIVAHPSTLGLAIFGSIARGDCRPNSDIEMLVISSGAERHEVSSSQRHGVSIHRHVKKTVDLQARRQIDWRLKPPFADSWIVLDSDGQLSRLRALDQSLAAAGRRKPTRAEANHIRTSLEDKIRELGDFMDDPLTFTVLYHSLLRGAIRSLYALAGHWEPGDKRLRADLEAWSPEFLFILAKAMLQPSCMDNARQVVSFVSDTS